MQTNSSFKYESHIQVAALVIGIISTLLLIRVTTMQYRLNQMELEEKKAREKSTN